MAREAFDVEVPSGTHLGFSRDSDGAYRAHLFDDGTNQLVGHAELFRREDAGGASNFDSGYDEDPSETWSKEDEELADAVAGLVLVGIIIAAQAAAPHVRRWWNDLRDRNRSRKEKRRSRKRRAGGDAAEAASSALTVTARAESSQQVFAALEEYKASMSSAEARERFVAALVARIYSEEQLRLLRDARIEDESGPLEIASAMDRLTPEQLGNSIRLMLESHPSWPDHETMTEIGKLLGRDGAKEYVPVMGGQVKRELPRPRQD